MNHPLTPLETQQRAQRARLAPAKDEGKLL